ncbi:MAG: ATP--guanido phosphotransferase [Planctomycetota bacterium]
MLTTLSNNQCAWLRGGESADVVLNSQVGFARNIAGYPFLSRADDRVIARIEELVRNNIMDIKVGEDVEYHRLDEMDSVTRDLLVERQLIGGEYAEADWPRGIAYSGDESVSIRVNEEDHLRIQVLHGGVDLRKAWEKARETDERLAARIPYAFSSQYGYLTACPTNVGTGMHASVVVHLPAMGLAKEMDKIIQLCNDNCCDVQGLYGDGSYASADVYRLSNQVTLGKREQDILDDMLDILDRIIGFERKARRVFSTRDGEHLRGRVMRAITMLRSAAELSCEESLNLLSQVRMGIEVGELEEVGEDEINQLLLLTLPAHLQTMDNRMSGRNELKKIRAEYLKKALAK